MPLKWISQTQPLPEAVLPSAPLRQAFAVQILQRLHDPHPGAALSLDFLNDWLNEQGVSLDEIVHREHADQIADNVTVRNIIISMRAISAFEWPQFVEDASLMDECLRAHDGYSAMDFLTRDRYRHAIEDLARRSPHSEVEIAHRVIGKVQRVNEQATADARQQEPGYYLIGAGRYTFEQEVDYRPSFKQRFLRGYIANAGLAYMGSLGLLTRVVACSSFVREPCSRPQRISVVPARTFWCVSRIGYCRRPGEPAHYCGSSAALSATLRSESLATARPE